MGASVAARPGRARRGARQNGVLHGIIPRCRRRSVDLKLNNKPDTLT
jgi:hypothetical protein